MKKEKSSRKSVAKKRTPTSHADGDAATRKKAKVENGSYTNPKPDAKLTKKDKKALRNEKKSRTKKNFNLIQEVTETWEILRRHDTTAARRSELVSDILDKIKGRIADLAGSHTASRVVQACVKHGAADEHQTIFKEISPHIVPLSKSPYGRFVVSKLITVASKDQIPNYLKAFKGHIVELLRHPAGTHVLDDLYSVCTSSQRNSLAAEFYGREYSFFSDGTLNNHQGPPSKLHDLMTAVDASKKRSILQFLASSIAPVIEKGLVDCQLSHRLISEYLQEGTSSLVVDAVEALSGDAMLHMMHTHQGAAAACMVMSYGTPKDRKKALKAMKGHVMAAVKDEWGHVVVMTALGVIDDTMLLHKVVTSDIQGLILILQQELDALISDKYAHRILLQLLSPDNPRYVTPTLLRIMHPEEKIHSGNSMASGAADDDGSDDELEEGNGGNEKKQGKLGESKKDPILRRRELLENGTLGKALVNVCKESASDLVASQYASDVVVEVCTGGKDNVLENVVGAEEIDAVHRVIVDAAKEGLEKDDLGVLGSYYGSRALRRLVLASQEKQGAATRFVDSLWKEVLQGKCVELHTTHAAKVLAAVVHSGSSTAKKGIVKELKSKVKNVEQWANDFVKK